MESKLVSGCYRFRQIPTPWSAGDTKDLQHDDKTAISHNRNTEGAVRPILPGVDAVVIMTMDTPTGRARARRLVRKYGRILATLCPKVYFQINKGYKTCHKRNVIYPHADLVHATLHAFCSTMHFNNILLLEDDAVFEITGLKLRLALKRVGNFIADRQRTNKPFNTYNLGAMAHALLPCGRRLQHRKIVGFLGAAQAVVWSRSARMAVLRSIKITEYPSGQIQHIDDPKFNPQLEDYAFTYKRPIVTQVFVHTENSEHWAVFGVDKHGWRRRANDAARKVVRGLIRVLNMDRQTQPGWNIMYGYGVGVTVFASLLLTSVSLLARTLK